MVANVVAVVVFLFFAALQVNDPDPWLWIPIYLAPALASALALAGRLPRWLPYAIGGAAVLGSIPLFFAGRGADLHAVLTDMAMHAAGVEEAREGLGLLIVAGWMAVLAVGQVGPSAKS
jgi:hypothetical protein